MNENIIFRINENMRIQEDIDDNYFNKMKEQEELFQLINQRMHEFLAGKGKC